MAVVKRREAPDPYETGYQEKERYEKLPKGWEGVFHDGDSEVPDSEKKRAKAYNSRMWRLRHDYPTTKLGRTIFAMDSRLRKEKKRILRGED